MYTCRGERGLRGLRMLFCRGLIKRGLISSGWLIGGGSGGAQSLAPEEDTALCELSGPWLGELNVRGLLGVTWPLESGSRSRGVLPPTFISDGDRSRRRSSATRGRLVKGSQPLGLVERALEKWTKGSELLTTALPVGEGSFAHRR